MDISSADFCKLTVQEVADMLLDHDKNRVLCRGCVDGRLYGLRVELIPDE